MKQLEVLLNLVEQHRCVLANPEWQPAPVAGFGELVVRLRYRCIGKPSEPLMGVARCCVPAEVLSCYWPEPKPPAHYAEFNASGKARVKQLPLPRY